MKRSLSRRLAGFSVAIGAFLFAASAGAQQTKEASKPAEKAEVKSGVKSDSKKDAKHEAKHDMKHDAKHDAKADASHDKHDDHVMLRDSVTIADVERAAEQLAVAVQAAVKKATESPELKLAALKVATSAVTAAQVAVTQQAATLQTVLEALAREIAISTAKQTKPKTH
ncbi:MAG TPA: hypothetical protein VNA21_03750 [Steroidobacteraceae bacterium]|nr:hypothetical protein [Steroidobacteraceae bacterium]